MHTPVRIVTIADLIAAGLTMSVYCARNDGPACWHGVRVDLEALAQRVGAGTRFVGDRDRLAGRFRCTACGSRRVTFRIAPPPSPVNPLASCGPDAKNPPPR